MKICLTQVTGFTYMSANRFSIFCGHLENESTCYFVASNKRNGITNDMALLLNLKLGTAAQTCNSSALGGEVGGSGG